MSPLKLNSMIKDLRDMHIFALNSIYFLRYVYERNFPSKKTCHKSLDGYKIRYDIAYWSFYELK